MPRKYNHNIDIGSKQLGNAIENIFMTYFGTIGLVVLIFIVYTIGWNIYKFKEKQSLLQNVIDLRPYTVANDLNNNRARYRINWRKKYVAYSGRIENISKSALRFDHGNYFNGTNSQKLLIICDYNNDSEVAPLNKGDYIKVIGELNVPPHSFGNQLDFNLRDCRIK